MDCEFTITLSWSRVDILHLLITLTHSHSLAQAEQRTQLLEYYFEKHTLSSAELAEIADRLGKKKMLVSMSG